MVNAPAITDITTRIEHHASLVSTNDEAMTLARAGEPGWLWIAADEQIGGRGRHGRPWHSPAGNLHASLLLVDPSPMMCAPQLGFVAGLALIDALRALAPDVPVQLKWPNDVVIHGAKLAGILVEGSTLADGRFACVIGVGVNCVAHPEGLAYRATSLKSLGVQIEAQDVLHALASAFVKRFVQWSDGGFVTIRENWLQNAAGLGRDIRVNGPGGARVGRFCDLDQDGRLVLDTDAGRHIIEAGDVFLLEGASRR